MSRPLTPTQLRSIREKLGLTQSALAEKLGMTRDAITSMESGRRPITRVTQLAIEHLSCKR
jgi:transcriptional regulator with XRE-family HTH domain